MRYRCIFAVLFTLSFVALGCHRGPVRGAIHGEVKYNGTPLANGQILFIPLEANSNAVAQTIIQVGNYTLSATDGPAVGKCRVEIRQSRKTGRMLKVPPDIEVEETVEAIPAKYNKESKIEFYIQPGDNEFNINLEN